MKRFLLAAMAGVIFANVPLFTSAVEYRFTNIADNTMSSPSGPFSGFGFSIDGAGFYNNPLAISGDRVAFHGSYQGGEGVFVGSGGPLTTIVKSGDPGPSGPFFRMSDIGISGEVASFRGIVTRPGPHEVGVFSGNGGPPTTIVKTGDPAPMGTIAGVIDPAIDDESIAFVAGYAEGGGIILVDQGSSMLIAEKGDPAPTGGFTAFEQPTIDNGTVAFTGVYPNGRGIFLRDGSEILTIAKTGDSTTAGTLSGMGEVSISGGTVAFLGVVGGPSQTGIFAGDGTLLTTIAAVNDASPFGNLVRFRGPAISTDRIAYQGFWEGGSGLFVDYGDEKEIVIKTGDTLFGSMVTNFGFERFGLDPDGSGNLAFSYVLADGRLGVAKASPVPEPCSFLTQAAILSVAFMARRRFVTLH